jgi:hypothetical protein
MDEGRGDRTSAGAEGDNSPASTPTGIAEPPRAAPASSSGNADAMASLRSATAGLESALAPIEKSMAPLQGLVAPLEPVGKQIMAFIGAVILFIGIFFFSVRSVSVFIASTSQSLWSFNAFFGLILLLSVIVAAGAAALRMYAWLWVASAAALLFVVLAFLSDLTMNGTGVPGLSWSVSWSGWIVLIIGLLALIASAAMRDTGKTIV